MPTSGDNFIIGPDNSLQIKNLGLSDLGTYTCQAYNGLSTAVSSTKVIRAMGPVDPRSVSPSDRRNLAYIVDAPISPYEPRPQPPQPYYPDTGSQSTKEQSYSQRPEYVEPETIATSPPMTRRTMAPRPEFGYLSVDIDSPRSRFPPGTNIMLPCTVNSYSKPVVFWEKNGQRLPENSLRIVVSRISWTAQLAYCLTVSITWVIDMVVARVHTKCAPNSFT